MKNKTKCYCGHTDYCDCSPLEQPKLEIIEEARDAYNASQERMYSEEEVRQMFNRYNEVIAHRDIEEWQAGIDKQFKK